MVGDQWRSRLKPDASFTCWFLTLWAPDHFITTTRCQSLVRPVKRLITVVSKIKTRGRDIMFSFESRGGRSEFDCEHVLLCSWLIWKSGTSCDVALPVMMKISLAEGFKEY